MSSKTIKVVVRAKPLITKHESVAWTIDGNNIYERDTTVGERFTFDKVFNVDQKNKDIYDDIISPLVHSAIEGINLTIFAYGSTSSGKTYTMNGTPNDPGIIPRIIEEIFYEMQMYNTRKFLIRVSYIEIYREIINDLLDKNNKDLKIREDINNFITYNATEKIIKSCEECLNIMKIGTANRTTGETLMNICSSRSHSIFRIIIESTPNTGSEQDPVHVSQVNLIDLAGSERVSQTGATGERFKEGAHINKSLTTLGLVIRQLVEKRDHISYRDSKLTRILSNSLGGNAETAIICNINLLALEDTQSTLLFAQRAKAVKVKPKVTVMSELSLTKKYSNECEKLKVLLDAELEKNKQLEQRSIMSRKEIWNLTSRIQGMEEMFVKKDQLKKPPKRRHTFCSILSAISEEKENGPLCIKSDFTDEAPDMPNLSECDSSLNAVAENSVVTKETTPKKVLRERLKLLINDMEELQIFTRLEVSTKCSIEKDMAQKISMLSVENSNLRSSLQHAESKIQALLLEDEKSKQTINDFEYIAESQKKRYGKRINELLEEINERNFSEAVLPQINTFEYEEMIDTIESLRKQNEKLHNIVDTSNAHNANSKYLEDKNEQLLKENRSLELANSEFQSKLSSLESENVKLNYTINALSLEVSQLKNRNQSLLSKCSELESQKNLLLNNLSNITSLEKQISDLKEQTCSLKSDLTDTKTQLNESLDKLLEITQDLDAEERKCSKLQEELELEKKLCREVQIKLDKIEQSACGERRFASDSLINQKCKSLDSSVLHMLRQLENILDPKPLICDNSLINISHTSLCTNLMQLGLENQRTTSNDFVQGSTENVFNMDLEKLKSFSSYLEDSADGEELISYCKSLLNDNSSQADDENVTAESHKSLNELSKVHSELLIQNEKLRSDISTMKLDNQSNIAKIDKLQNQLDGYYYINLSDAEKLEKTNVINIGKINTFDSLQTEKINSLLLREKLECDKENDEAKENFKVLCDKEQNKQAKLEVTNYQKIIQQLKADKQELENLKSDIETLKTSNNDLKILNSEKEGQILELHSELQEYIETKKKLEKDQDNFKQSVLEVENYKILIKQFQSQVDTLNKINNDLNSHNRLEAENYQKLLKQLQLEKQVIDNLQSEIDTLKKTNNNLKALNAEKDNELLNLHADLKENIEIQENLKTLFEKEQDMCKQARVEVENEQKLIENLQLEKQQLKNLQLQVDVLTKTSNDLKVLLSEKDRELLELHNKLKEYIQSKENLKVLFEKEENSFKESKLELENYQRLIEQVQAKKQEFDNLQSEIDTLKKTNKELKVLNAEKDDLLFILRAELKESIETKENWRKLFEKEQDKCKQSIVEVENSQKLINNLQSKKQEFDNLQSEVDTLKKINTDFKVLNSKKDDQLLHLHAELKDNIEAKENLKTILEKEQDMYKQAKVEIEGYKKLMLKLKEEKQNLLESSQDTNCRQVDFFNMKINALMTDIEQKDTEIVALNSKFQQMVSEKHSISKLIETFEKVEIKLKEEKKALLQQLNILERKTAVEHNKSNVQSTDRIMIDKFYSEICKLKDILPKNESSRPDIRELLLYNRRNLNDNSKLRDIKLLVNKVSSLIEERNLLKHEKIVGYETLRHNIMEELEAKKRQNDSVVANLKTSENQCEKLRKNNDTYRSEIEQLRASMALMQAKELYYKSQAENLSFENQNLAEKVKDIEKLQLIHKKMEQKLQSLVDENNILYRSKAETEEQINPLEIKNRQLIKCYAAEKIKEIGMSNFENSNNEELVKKKEIDIVKGKYELLKKRHQQYDQHSEVETTIACRKENKWKQQRTESHDSRRSIDLNTLCLETVVDTCNNCEYMSHKLQRTKAEIVQLRQTIKCMSSSEFEELKGKYETLKKLCRMRNQEISKLKASLTEKK